MAKQSVKALKPHRYGGKRRAVGEIYLAGARDIALMRGIGLITTNIPPVPESVKTEDPKPVRYPDPEPVPFSDARSAEPSEDEEEKKPKRRRYRRRDMEAEGRFDDLATVVPDEGKDKDDDPVED